MENAFMTPKGETAGLIVGIDASRNRSGGAIAHLKGIIDAFDVKLGIAQVHVWAFKSLLDGLPDRPWLFKHHHPMLEKSLFQQLWWQASILKRDAERIGCHVLFATDASTLCNFHPLVVLSQDLLSYEPGVMQTYRLGRTRLRLEVIKRVQNIAFRRAIGVLFLTEYARKLVQASCGNLSTTALAPHGVDDAFRIPAPGLRTHFQVDGNAIRCTYVSSADFYKHQWNVVKAIRLLRDQGILVTLTLIGGGSGKARQLLDRTIAECGGAEWTTQLDFLKHSELPAQLDHADIFVFASSCENLPVTLLEGMAKALPIACSNRGPMPEVLGDGGEYFDPLDPTSIADSIGRLIASPDRRKLLATTAHERADTFTWSECSNRTFSFIRNSYFQYVTTQ
ncbi:glycosyltransferase [Paucibacter sp. Y2R2-4]|uniref:glycosyltransferase n=1 Tax=Paucibacter sp. Y2R2-4 TaxID=2893553 RepID=UPI0021E4656D|nr:glycosyltransferase [Paucibacter sp. Y2R2-4]MCV2349733.1 glycosyltransferase [Paucibacter sp. Y2R2-4]